MGDPLLVERTEHVVTLTFNRPDSLNSLNAALKDALREALTEVSTDPGCRAVVLAGAGRAFCVGQDLREHVETLERGDVDPLATVLKQYNPIVESLAGMPKPVV